MYIIELLAVEDSTLAASNVMEPENPVWSSGSSYSQGDFVNVISNHRVYQAVIANSGQNPVTDDGTNWIDIGPSNRWAAFDGKNSTRTERAGAVSFTFDLTSTVTGVALFGLDAAQAAVQVFDANSQLVFGATKSLVDTTEIVDWFTYATWAPDYQTEALFTDLPGYSGGRVRVEVASGGTASVGTVALGRVSRLGETLDGTEITFEDFSRIDRDDFGDVSITERGWADETSFQFLMPSADAYRVKRILTRNRAQRAVYFSDPAEGRLGTLVLGIAKPLSIPLKSDGNSFASLEVEGVN